MISLDAVSHKTYFNPFHPFRNNYQERELLKKWLKHYAERGIKVCVTTEINKLNGISIPKIDGDGRSTERGECFILWVNHDAHMEYAERVAGILFPTDVLKQQMEIEFTHESMELDGIEFKDFDNDPTTFLFFEKLRERLEVNRAESANGGMPGSHDAWD